jgi:uncharacterized protein
MSIREKVFVAIWLFSASFALPSQAQVLDEGGFVVRMGADTFAVERFTRTADRLEGEMRGAAVGRMVYFLALGREATAPELTMRAWMPGAAAESAPRQEVRVSMRSDSAIVRISAAGGEQTQRFLSEPLAIPYVNPSFALTEQIVRRAFAIGGEEVRVPVFMLQGGQTISFTVRRTGQDSVSVIVGGAAIEAVVDPSGRLLRGAIPAQRLSFERAEVDLDVINAAPPDYSAPEGAPYQAEDVTVVVPAGHTLAGTLTIPHDAVRAPAVVLISGSGLQDRDHALSILPGYRPFREIADVLGAAGIAVLRLDDRGFGASTGDASVATSADFADDIRAAVAYLRARSDIFGDRIALAGLSEGGLIAPMVAAEDTLLAGIVLLNGPALTGREIIRYQQRSMLERSTDGDHDIEALLDQAHHDMEAMAERQPWLRFFLDYDPLAMAARVRNVPVLVLHGATDRQVTLDQAPMLADAFREAGNPDVTLTVLPAINHLLVPDPDGSPQDYVLLEDRSVAAEVLAEIREWLVARLVR